VSPDPAARRALPAHATSRRRRSPATLRELLGQRGQIEVVSRQLAVIDQRNAQLSAENAALGQRATVAAIAHEDYGLVGPGQKAYVILPAATDHGQGLLGRVSISRAQMVSGDPTALTGIGTAGPAAHSFSGASAGNRGGGGGSLLSRTLDHLEFWRWAF
jgi:hypothetical protein